MSLPEKAFPVSWDQFHRDARALAWRISGMGNGLEGDRLHHPRRPRAGGHHFARARHPRHRDGLRRQLSRLHTQGDIEVLKEVSANLLDR
jgi:xanthine phosphoribosyltransferase